MDSGRETQLSKRRAPASDSFGASLEWPKLLDRALEDFERVVRLDIQLLEAKLARLLIETLRGVENRSARYVCVIALAEAGKVLRTFRGEAKGSIVDEPRGNNGFGYDPYFYYAPLLGTFAQASPEQKLRVSHRGRAMASMLAWLRTFTAQK